MTLADEELEDGYREMAGSFNQPAEEIKKYYQQNKESLELFKHTLLEKKAINLIIECSKIKEVEPELEKVPKTEKTPSE